MNQAANAYARAAKAGETARETEAFVLLNAAFRLQAIRDGWTDRQGELDGALAYNRKIWAILSAGAVADDNPLPSSVKQGIGNLAAFVFRRTVDTLVAPAPEKLSILVSINRDIAAGLRSVPAMTANAA